MEAQQNQDFTKPQIGPTRGIVTAEEAKKRREEEPVTFDTILENSLTQTDDFRKSPLFKNLFDDPDFRRAVLNAKYLE